MTHTTTTGWRRVTKAEPCPICGKPDWCGIADDGTAAICMRRDSDKPTDNGGHLHKLTDAPRRLPEPSRRQHANGVDWRALSAKFASAIADEQIAELAAHLHVDVIAVRELGTGFDTETGAYTMPMHDATGSVCGIQRRFIGRDGDRKQAMPGSSLGVFRRPTPTDASEGVLLVCEGCSDTLAALSFGFDALGVASAGSCRDIVPAYVEGRDVAIMQDADAAGARHAADLAVALREVARSVRIVTPPCKDVRQWRCEGATREDIDAAIATATAIEKPRPMIEFLRPWQLADLPPRRPLWDGVIAAGELAELFGPWGTCKSFVGLGLGLAMVDGVPFMGHDVAQGTALIVCGEGAQGQADRLRAAAGNARMANRDDPLHRHLAIACSMPPLTQPAAFDATVRAIEAIDKGPSLLIVDTYARACAASGVDENATGESGKMVAAFDRLRSRFPGMALLAIHHSGNDRNDRSRGSSVLPSACDAILRVDPIKAPGTLPRVRLSADKVKDGRKPVPVLIDFAEAVVRTDEKGRPVTSLRVDTFVADTDETDAPGDKAGRQTAADRILTALRESGRLTFAEGKKAATKADATVSEAFGKLVANGVARPGIDDKGNKYWLWIGGAP